MDWKIPFIVGVLLIIGINTYFYLDERFVEVPVGDVTYFWDFGDGTTISTETPEHIFEKGGTYKVTLTITNGTVSTKKKFVIDATEGMKYAPTIIPIKIEGFES